MTCNNIYCYLLHTGHRHVHTFRSRRHCYVCILWVITLSLAAVFSAFSQLERLYKTGCGACGKCDPPSAVAYMASLSPRGHMLQKKELCCAVKCILLLKTLTTEHKLKPSNDSLIRPYELKEDLRCGFGSYYCLPDRITEIDGSDDHNSWSFWSWLSVPGCTLPAGLWFIVSLAIC